MTWKKDQNTKKSWYKSNFVEVLSNFNSRYYNTLGETCQVKLRKGFRRFPQNLITTKVAEKKKKILAKWGTKVKIKSHLQNCIPDSLKEPLINLKST